MTPERQTILLVEDDRRLSSLIKDYLEQYGFSVSVEGRGDTAVERIVGEQPDLAILDLMLPGKDGLSVCQLIRSTFPGPILILTAREDDFDQVAGLESGADDYVKKPVEPRVLLARIRALLRRAAPVAAAPRQEGGETLVFGALRILPSSHRVILAEQAVEVTTNEFELLHLLAANEGQVLDRDTIMARLRGIPYDGMDRWVDVSISRLRRKLEEDPANPRGIRTIWGQGYLFVGDVW